MVNKDVNMNMNMCMYYVYVLKLVVGIVCMSFLK